MGKRPNNLPGAGPGRPKGSKDKITRDLKKLVLDTAAKLEEDGKSLHEEAQKDPKWFYMNFLKPMLPKPVIVAGDPDNPIETSVKVSFVKTGDQG